MVCLRVMIFVARLTLRALPKQKKKVNSQFPVHGSFEVLVADSGAVKTALLLQLRWKAYLRVWPGALSFPAESSPRARVIVARLLPLAVPSTTRPSAKSQKPRQTWLFLRRRSRHDTT